MEKIVVKTGNDVLTLLDTQIEFSSLQLGTNFMLDSKGSLTIQAKKQWLKKDGITIHNEESIQLGIKFDDTDEQKIAKEALLVIFETAIKLPLTKLITSLTQ